MLSLPASLPPPPTLSHPLTHPLPPYHPTHHTHRNAPPQCTTAPLRCSSSFGDPDFKEPRHLVTATPDVIRERLAPGDDFVVLASDGLVRLVCGGGACVVCSARGR